MGKRWPVRPPRRTGFLLWALRCDRPRWASSDSAAGGLKLEFAASASYKFDIMKNTPGRCAPFPTILILVASFCAAAALRAQPGAWDPAFYRTSVFDGTVFGVAVQPDGRVLVGGAFTSVTGVPRRGIARVNRSASLDPTFDPGLGVEGKNAGVYALALYSDGTNAGKVVIVGSFTNVNRVARFGVARLNPDGSLDPSFSPGTGIEDGDVYAVAIQADDKVVVGGSFISVQGAVRPGLARFNADGSLDSTFRPGTGTGGGETNAVDVVAVQPDGKIVIGGSFTTFRGVARAGIARLTSTGTLDLTSAFDPGTGAEDGSVYALALQTDGGILMAGDFGTVQGQPRDGVARLNTDGSLDTVFAPSSGGGNAITVWAVAPVGSNQVLVAGEFTVMANEPCDGIARLNADGSQDAAFTNRFSDTVRFNVGNGEYVLTLALRDDGSVVAGGTFELVNNLYRPTLCQLTPDGDVDPVFNQESGTFDSVLATALQPDGKLVLGGQFTLANGASRRGLARLNADGLLDGSFDPGAGVVGRVFALAAYTNGPKLGQTLLGGAFTSVGGVAASGLARVNTNGVVDTNFSATILSNDVEAVVLQTDGKILIGGTFTNVNGAPRSGVARLNADGGLDGSFDPGRGIAGAGVHSLALQTNGFVVIGGAFTNFDGTPRNGLARLTTTGALDASFDPGSGVAGGPVRALTLQPDGGLLIGGGFATARGAPRSGVARFNPDGTLDAGFDPGAGIGDGEIRALALQTNGQIFIGGSFTNFNRLPCGGLARLNADGSFDYGFDPGSGLAYVGQVRAKAYSLTLQPDGQVVVGGAFLTINGVGSMTAGNIARLVGGAAVPTPPRLTWWPTDITALSGDTVSLSVQAAGSKPLSYQWLFNSGAVSGQTNALLQLNSVTTNQAGAYAVLVTNAVGAVTSPPVALKVIVTVQLGPALNAPWLSWTTGGDRSWYGETTVTHDGVAAAQSGPITDNQQTYLTTTVPGPGRVTFWWKVSSEAGFDLLDFSINNSGQAEISGEADWAQLTLPVPAGPATLSWVYSKDPNNAAGLDAGWVDQVSYVQAPTLTAGTLPDGRLQLSVQASPDQSVAIQASTNLTDWATIEVVTNSGAGVRFTDDAATNFNRRFYRTLTP